MKTLTARELEVMKLVADGHTNESICHQLGNSVDAVKSHLSRIFRKTGCTNRIDLAAMVWKQRHDAEIARLHEHYSSIDLQSH